MMKNSLRQFHNERGIALLLVLGSVFILTTLVIEFALRSNVQYHLALNNADRLQAYYLAQSAINFSKLLIRYDKEIQGQLSKHNLDVPIEPLYRMFPLSSTLLRAAMEGGAGEGEDKDNGEPSGEEEAYPSQAEEEDHGSEIGTALSILASKEAQDFLSFHGDFELEVEEVETKIDLNIFYALPKTDASYDARKRWLMALLSGGLFKKYFDRFEGDLTPETVVYSLADWVDQNEGIDELGGEERGSEAELYAERDYGPKNGKLLSLEEIGLVPGITPELLSMLAPFLTIYNTTGQFNACLADETLVQAFIGMYSQSNSCVSPLNPIEDKEQIESLATVFLGACPKTDEMVQLLDEALGLGVGEDVQEGCSRLDLKQILTDKRSVFHLIGRGVVGETTVEVRTVLNTASENPAAWPLYYWRVN